MSGVDDDVDRYFQLQHEIFEHVGYVENWRCLPLADSREMFWSLNGEGSGDEVRYSPRREALEYWNADHDDECGPHGDCLYANPIYTQRHLPRWVYRGEVLTLVVVDTQVDGNKLLQLFRNDHEVLR